MRKVNLRMNEYEKYIKIKNLVETNGNKKRVAVELDLSIRQINRLIAGYKAYGKEFFVHGNRNKIPVNKISYELRQNVIELYTTKYFDCNFTFFRELLLEHENINISLPTIMNIMYEENIISPRSHRITKRRIKELLKIKEQSAKKKSEVEEIKSKQLSLEFAHPTQPRSKYFGEEIQMDGCLHRWFDGIKTTLHAVIDDATGQVIGAYFDKEETLNGYYNITKQFLLKYGIPLKIKTDNRTVFAYKRKNSPSDEDDVLTQYGYACKQLGIEIETSSVPEFKARIERVFQTFQNRLPKLFELNGIHTIEEANKFISKYLIEFNKQFALPINNTKSVFINQLEEEKIDLILSVLSNRIINSGHSIQYNNKSYKTIDKDGNTIFYGKGTKCIVIKTFDNKLYASVENQLFELEEIPIREEVSANFDEVKEVKITKRKIPNMLHPWREKSFNEYMSRQTYRQTA
jgi:hypothetical protein